MRDPTPHRRTAAGDEHLDPAFYLPACVEAEVTQRKRRSPIKVSAIRPREVEDDRC